MCGVDNLTALWVEVPDVAIAQIIGQDVDDVGLLVCLGNDSRD